MSSSSTESLLDLFPLISKPKVVVRSKKVRKDQTKVRLKESTAKVTTMSNPSTDTSQDSDLVLRPNPRRRPTRNGNRSGHSSSDVPIAIKTDNLGASPIINKSKSRKGGKRNGESSRTTAAVASGSSKFENVVPTGTENVSAASPTKKSKKASKPIVDITGPIPAARGFGTEITLDNQLAQQSPSKMSTLDLLNHQSTMSAGIKMLCQLTSKKASADEIGARIGLQKKSSRSPGLTASSSGRMDELIVVPAKRTRPRRNCETKVDTGKTSAVGKSEDDQNDHDESSSQTEKTEDDHESERGEALFRELVSRYDNLQFGLESIDGLLELCTDTCSTASLYPNYEEKKRIYENHSKKICKLSIERLTHNFNKISEQLKAVPFDNLKSERHELFKKGKARLKELRGLNVSLPFTSDHTAALIDLLYHLLVPDLDERPLWSFYLNDVMLPEALIRIYARVNNISLEWASTEMRFGARYDGPILQ